MILDQNMPNGWCRCQIKDIVSLERNALVGGPFGSNLVQRDYTPYGVPVIRGQNMSMGRWVDGEFVYVSEEKAMELAANIARPGDIVFTQRGTLGQVALVPETPFETYVISQSQMKLTVDETLADSRFVYYYFSSPQMQHYIRANAIQTGVPHTNLGILRHTPVIRPPLPEQRAIAHILGTLDDKIELNRKMNETLDEIARVLFTSWFVNFDPVRAKSEGRQPEGMDADTAALFPDRFEESELGLIPEGWNWSTIGNEVSIVGGGTPSTKASEFWEGGEHWWTTPKDLSGLQAPILTRTARKVTDLGLQRISSGLLPKNSVLLSSRAPIGYVALPSQPTAINQGFIGMVCDKNLGTPFVLNWTRENMEQIKSRANGSTFQEISKTNFRTMPLLIPDLQITKFYEQIAGSLYALIEKNLHEAGTLAELRDTLLPRLLSGELRVPEVEDMLAPVAAQSVEARG